MTPDVIETRRGALIQHGPLNGRIYLMKIGTADLARLLPDLEVLARERGYTKIFARAPAARRAAFVAAGYRVEATVPGLYRGGEDGDFLGRFLDPARARPGPEVAGASGIAETRTAPARSPAPPAGVELRACGPGDADAMSLLFGRVFPSYPFPIHDPAFLRRTMAANTRYFGARRNGTWVALSSAELDPEAQCAEMTDFATDPAERGRGLASALLSCMEKAVERAGVRTAFTIARAASPGINAVFARAGYRFDGALVNNTQIGGRIETMHVWHKPLPA